MIDLLGTSDDLRDLTARGVQRSYAKGRLLIEEGDAGDTLFIIVSGRLRAFSESHGREIIYGSYGPGEYVGEMSLDGGARSANVVTLERSLCSVVTRRTLEAFIAERPAFAFELLAKVIARARAATVSARMQALNDAYGRLRFLLESMAVARPDGTRHVPERMTHKEMASHVGCGREMVSRLLKDLERGGYIEVSTRSLVLCKALPVRW